MKTWERRLICGGLSTAGALFLFAAIKPTFNGLPLNVTFLLLGVVLLVGGIAAWRISEKSAREEKTPRQNAQSEEPKVDK